MLREVSMEPEEHAFYMRKIAQLEVRIIQLESLMTEVDGKMEAADPTAASDPEAVIRKITRLN
jgi:hypothetical protein